MKTTIVKWGNSQGIRLPKHLLKSADIGEHDTLEIVAENQSIVITKVSGQGHKTIQERFQGFTGACDTELIDWGEPEGKEAW